MWCMNVLRWAAVLALGAGVLGCNTTPSSGVSQEQARRGERAADEKMLRTWLGNGPQEVPPSTGQGGVGRFPSPNARRKEEK
jgi:hypothetical protein